MLPRHYSAVSAAVVCVLASTICFAQQSGDQGFKPRAAKPRYTTGTGPLVAIDEAHGNFHTRTGRYAAFARLLEADGYRVASLRTRITGETLSKLRALVIANALHPSNAKRWELPTPSAFTDEEIEHLVRFVTTGGSLLLIADHMPFPGAADKLARRFGVRFENGFNAAKKPDGSFQIQRSLFRRSSKGIASHPITDGPDTASRVDQVATFVGTVFRLEENTKGRKSAAPLLVMPESTVVVNPKRAWKFDKTTPRKDADGWLQGAAIEFGEGRVVVFAEAAMFTAQTTGGGGKMGFHTKEAKDNQKLLRNVLHWLTPAGL